MDKSPEAFRTISEVSEWLDTPAHVLRFWESRFTQVKPVKRAGGRRYYRPADMQLLGGIKRLLHEEGLTIRGVQKILREEGTQIVGELSPPLPGETSIPASARDTLPPLPAVRRSTVRPLKRVRDDEAPMIEIAEAAPEDNIVPFAERGPTPHDPAGHAAAPLPGLFQHDPAPASDTAPDSATDDPTGAVDRADAPGLLAGTQPERRENVETAPNAAPDSAADTAAAAPTPSQPDQDAAPDHPAARPDTQPDFPADAETGPQPGTPLGLDLPAEDPADDDPAFAPTDPPLRIRLRATGLRRVLRADSDRLSAAVTRLRDLAARMDGTR